MQSVHAVDRPTRQFDVRARNLFGRHLLLRVHVTMETNEVGFLIWSMCDGTRTVPEIAQQVAERYGIEETTARQDCDDFLSSLDASQFITWVAA